MMIHSTGYESENWLERHVSDWLYILILRFLQFLCLVGMLWSLSIITK